MIKERRGGVGDGGETVGERQQTHKVFLETQVNYELFVQIQKYKFPRPASNIQTHNTRIPVQCAGG